MDILELLNKIRHTHNCVVHPPCGMPTINSNLVLPPDLLVFYESCGGITLFPDEPYSFTIVSPDEMCLANPIIVGELCEEDISSNWYIICKNADNDYITIDLANERVGRCYDSFWDRHGVVGDCSIVASNFTDLLNQLYNNRGQSIFWLDDNFCYIGDAYDKT